MASDELKNAVTQRLSLQISLFREIFRSESSPLSPVLFPPSSPGVGAASSLGGIVARRVNVDIV